MTRIKYIEGHEELIDDVEPLWKRLNEHHQGISTHFSCQIGQVTFSQRRSHWLYNLKSGQLRIDLAQIQDSNALVGYCVTKIIADLGEIESLYVDEPFRKMGIGNCLITRALNWLNSRSVKTKRVNVAVGNEQVLRFYGRYGFLSRSITLEQKL
jgi:ribosomal protein S18 acetylase RimI-like enzyme